MYVNIRLEPNSSSKWFGDTEKQTFWRTIVVSSSEGESRYDEDPKFPLGEADHLEQLFRENFARYLDDLVNREVSSRVIFRSSYLRSFPGRVRFRLVSLKYGSLTSLIDVAGIDAEDIRTATLDALEAFAPAAFQQSIRLPAETTASVEVVEKTDANSGAGTLAKGTENAKKAWYIANTTLLVPVGLALAICYFTFLSLTHQIETIRTEEGLAQKEKTEIIKALASQNAGISQQLLNLSKNADARAKSIDDAVIKSIEKK